METLKARAYDLILTMESCQVELQKINNEIARLNQVTTSSKNVGEQTVASSEGNEEQVVETKE